MPLRLEVVIVQGSADHFQRQLESLVINLHSDGLMKLTCMSVLNLNGQLSLCKCLDERRIALNRALHLCEELVLRSLIIRNIQEQGPLVSD